MNGLAHRTVRCLAPALHEVARQHDGANALARVIRGQALAQARLECGKHVAQVVNHSGVELRRGQRERAVAHLANRPMRVIPAAVHSPASTLRPKTRMNHLAMPWENADVSTRVGRNCSFWALARANLG